MTGQTPRSGNDTAINLGLGLIAALGVVAGLLRAAGTIAAWLTGTHEPAGNFGAGLAVLAHPTRPAVPLRAPGLSPFAYWAVVAALMAAAGLIAWLAVRLARSHGDSRDDPRRRAGLATTAQVRKVASGRALRRRAARDQFDLVQAAHVFERDLDAEIELFGGAGVDDRDRARRAAEELGDLL